MILSELLTPGADLAALASELSVPTLAGLQHQGDISVVPAAMVTDYRRPRTRLPRAGFPVVRGESTGHAHLLLAAGLVLFDPCDATATDLTLGCLLVPDGAAAYLDHPEHGNSGIAPGEYVLRRKREQADELRLIAD